VMPRTDIDVKTIQMPAAKVPLGLADWSKDFPDASSFLPQQVVPAPFGADQSALPEAGNSDSSLLGASAPELRRFGYSVTAVPSVNDRVDECMRATGLWQTQCWARLDMYLMQEVVPWVPFVSATGSWTVSSRVTKFSFDQFAAFPALDRIALKQGSA